MSPIIQIDDLVVEYTSDRYTVRPVDGFGFHADAGRLVALRGPSGSGKTTLLSILSGMVPAAAGTVYVDGIDVLSLHGSALEAYRRDTVGIVFQGFNLIPSLNARENVATPLLVAGVPRREALARADALLAEVGIADRGDHLPKHLSGGQQQRVAVARGLVNNPKVLLADEPTANLDRASAESVVELLRRLRDHGRTIVVSTHDDRLLPAMDDVVFMHPEGEAESAPPVELASQAGNAFLHGSDRRDFVYDIRDGGPSGFFAGAETVTATPVLHAGLDTGVFAAAARPEGSQQHTAGTCPLPSAAGAQPASAQTGPDASADPVRNRAAELSHHAAQAQAARPAPIMADTRDYERTKALRGKPKNISVTLLICCLASLIAAVGLFLPARQTGAPSNEYGLHAGAGSGVPTEAVVEIINFGFREPGDLVPGQTVLVTNNDSVPHTLTAVDGAFDTGWLGPGEQARITVPDSGGSFAFFCEIHPSMRGVLEVSAS